MGTEVNNEYGADQIQILEGLEAVRKRPGMYIGSTSIRGLHHLVYEIVDNSVDEALAGYCTEINVTIEKDNSITVIDNGRGIPVGINHKANKPAVEVVFTVLHAGGKFGGGGYKVSGGLHGVGASVVNALSEWLEVKIHKDGKLYQQRYERGKVMYPLKEIGVTDHNGTEVRFLPDKEIFEETEFDYNTLRQRLREMAFLTKGIKIVLRDNRLEEPKIRTFHYEGGIKEYVEYLNKSKEKLYDDIIYCEGQRGDVYVEVALQHNDSYQESTYSFVNNITTPEGGTHVTGFKSGFAKLINSYARNELGLLKEKDANLSGADIRSGMQAIISVKHPDPQFEGQTKTKLSNTDVTKAVDDIVKEQLTVYFDRNYDVLKDICDRAVSLSKKKALEKSKINLNKFSFEGNGKLAKQESNDSSKCEIFIVEGDSAGGSAKTARNRKYQAILPLRGKILNVEKKTVAKVLENAEIKALINAFGCGFMQGYGNDFDINKLNYDKIIIMTDADVDGAHIATLLLTFLYRFMPELIKQGYVYLAQPPLYKVEKNKKVWYAYDDDELNQILTEIGRDGNNKIQRYKGLGEMDADQLWETTMDPEKRILLKVTMDEAATSEIDLTFTTLMGDKVEPRREFIEENARFVKNLDI